MQNLPFSQACENNKLPILNVLQKHLSGKQTLLEIGSGTGQHAVFFSSELPMLEWQPSDMRDNIDGLTRRFSLYSHANLLPVVELDVTWPESRWPTRRFDVVFTANTAHIMPREAAHQMVEKSARALLKNGLLMVYGPFKYRENYTSESNSRFDEWLKEINPEQGIRAFEELNAVAHENGLRLLEDNSMPANNQFIIWKKEA